MSAVYLADLHHDTTVDEELVAAHGTEAATGCCEACGEPWPCDTRLDAGNRLNNRLLAMHSH